MSLHNLSLQLVPRSGTASGDAVKPFVTLEPVPKHLSQSYITIAEIYRLWQRALSGIAAGSYKPANCPIEFEDNLVRVWFDFYVLPSSMELGFALSPSIGEIDTPEIIDLDRERDIVFEMQDYCDLDFLPLSASLAWDTRCYIDDCNVVPSPQPEMHGSRITVSQPLFGVARLEAVAWCKKYRLLIELEKDDTRITLDDPVITCVWSGGEQQLTLAVPDCVKHALALCDGDFGTTFCGDGPEPPTTVYIDGCDGESTLGVKRGDPESWCHRS